VSTAIILNLLYGRANVYPLTSREVARTHLVRSSVALLEGAATTELDRYNAIADAIAYEMPDLIDVSLSNVVKLRQDEDVFADVRSALTELAESTSTADSRSYAHYHRDVRDRAEDLVRPKFENFAKVAFRKNLLSAATSFAAGKMVRLGINSLASLTGEVAHPVTDPLARAADKATRSLVNQRIVKSGSAREIAKTILLSVLQ
jgi:hypothetical protein